MPLEKEGYVVEIPKAEGSIIKGEPPVRPVAVVIGLAIIVILGIVNVSSNLYSG